MVEDNESKPPTDEEVVRALHAAEPSNRIAEHVEFLRHFDPEDPRVVKYRELIDRAKNFHAKDLVVKLRITLANLVAERERLLRPPKDVVDAGIKAQEGQSRGGTAKAVAQRPEILKRLAAMDSYIKKGLSVRNAARLTASDVVGPSADANRKLWTNHRKK